MQLCLWKKKLIVLVFLQKPCSNVRDPSQKCCKKCDKKYIITFLKDNFLNTGKHTEIINTFKNKRKERKKGGMYKFYLRQFINYLMCLEDCYYCKNFLAAANNLKIKYFGMKGVLFSQNFWKLFKKT